MDVVQAEENVLNAYVLFDSAGVITAWNASAEALLGWPASEAVGQSLLGLMIPLRHRPALRTMAEKLFSAYDTSPPLHCQEVVLQCKDGGTMAVECELAPLQVGSQRYLGASIHRGASQTVEALSALSPVDHLQPLFNLYPDGMFAFDQAGFFISANNALCALTGYAREELTGMSYLDIMPAEAADALRARFAAACMGLPQTQDCLCVRKDGSHFDGSITMLPLLVGDRPSGVQGILKDISRHKEDQRRIHFLATHDPLTRLPNRTLLHDRMQHAIDHARRTQAQLGVLFMDLNRFKIINDSLGHDMGDLLLCVIGERIKDAIRDVDTVARLGGDEFVILLENVGGGNDVLLVVQNLLKLIAQPVSLNGNMVTVTTSIGASVFPRDGEDAGTLLKNADLAMYEAKRSGASFYCAYDQHMNTNVVNRLELEVSLRQALEKGQLTVHYQPRLDISRNSIVSLEALVRWDHPERGLVYPVSFIPLAEEIGMIDAIGQWVLLEACRQIKRWQDAGLFSVRLSVNVSALQLHSEQLCDTISNALRISGLEPSLLELEITESSLMRNLDTSHKTLSDIRRLGVSVSIDDFGTGYASLTYLKRLPVDTLKIDKSFINDVLEDSDDAAIVSATIAMAHSMDLRVVAEGVTTFDQLNFLAECGCDEIQGYLLCQPLPGMEAENFLRNCELRGIYYSWTH